jgi:hypothetical protein
MGHRLCDPSIADLAQTGIDLDQEVVLDPESLS